MGKSGFCRRREPDAHLCLLQGAGKPAARADVTRVFPFGVTAEHHTPDDICDICTLIDRDFVFHTEIAPAKPMITEDLTEPVMSGGVIRVLKRRTNDFLRAVWRIHSNFCCMALYQTAILLRDNTKSSFVHVIIGNNKFIYHLCFYSTYPSTN